MTSDSLELNRARSAPFLMGHLKYSPNNVELLHDPSHYRLSKCYLVGVKLCVLYFHLVISCNNHENHTWKLHYLKGTLGL